MASIDKAAIGIAVAITAIFLVIAAGMDAAQNAAPTISKPVISKTIEPEVQAESTNVDTDLIARQNAAEKAAAEAAAEKAAAEAAAEKAAAEAAAEKAAAEAAAEKAAAEAAAPKTVIVDIPVGTAVPGCEETDECFLPPHITINAGDTVEWANIDTAAHTVTGGTPADGPSGVFDSSLLMGSGSYAFTFDEAGSYDYFCMVHPWMVGSVSVN
ncbi:MAG: Plastocyanin [Nitrosopumilus sp.]|nr:Plastocyanin [Nitrosopumilus sp.]